MRFPLLKFWKYTPLGFLAAVVFTVSDILGVRAPFAPQLLGFILRSRPKKKPIDPPD